MPKSLEATIRQVLAEDQNASPTRVKPEYQDLGDPAVAPGQPKTSTNKASDTISHAQDPRPKPSAAGPDDQRASDPEHTDNYPKNKDLKNTPGDPGGHGTLPNDHQGSGEAPVNPKKAGAKSISEEGDDELDEMDSVVKDKDDDLDEEKGVTYSVHEGDDEDKDDDKKDNYKVDKDDVNEAMSKIFDGEELSEEFKTKVETLFSIALKESVGKAIVKLEGHYEKKLNSRVEEIRESLGKDVDAYLSYVSEEWLKKNEVAVERGIRAEIAESFISGMKNLFEELYIDIPASKIDAVAELVEKVEKVEKELAEQVDNNVTLVGEIQSLRRDKIINEAVKDLSETDSSRVRDLAEDVDYKSDEAFAKSVKVIVESTLSGNTKKKGETLTDQVITESTNVEVLKEASDPAMEKYLKTLSKMKRP